MDPEKEQKELLVKIEEQEKGKLNSSNRARAMTRNQNDALLKRNDLNDVRSSYRSVDSNNSASFRDKRMDLHMRTPKGPSLKAGINHMMEEARHDAEAFQQLSKRINKNQETSELTPRMQASINRAVE